MALRIHRLIWHCFQCLVMTEQILMSYVLSYISQELLEIYEYDEEHARDWSVDNLWKKYLQEQIE